MGLTFAGLSHVMGSSLPSLRSWSLARVYTVKLIEFTMHGEKSFRTTIATIFILFKMVFEWMADNNGQFFSAKG